MRYCNSCVYPENARPGVIFDSEGVCSGCRLIESRKPNEKTRAQCFRISSPVRVSDA